MDLYLAWPNAGDPTTGDFQAGPDGDLLTCTGFTETMQRIVRRFLSNNRSPDPNGPGFLPPDDTFNPDYGLGLRRQVGRPTTRPAAIIGAAIGGMRAEAPEVALTPPPQCQYVALADGFALLPTYTEGGTGILRAIPQINVAPNT